MGELLVAERPLCVWPQGLTPEGINELYSALSPRQQSVFMSLATNEQKEREGMDPLLARRGTNGFSVTLPVGGRTVGMVFPSIARINHSW
ncbi:hypothetical protein MNV49_002756 [Pseudohyphozyma bogoriensis]|nr:hypothetical protein MNV49_002756 [Pseudohyphozyma bogoriensis]